jgi:uncharacterized protein (DUF3084 family)
MVILIAAIIYFGRDPKDVQIDPSVIIESYEERFELLEQQTDSLERAVQERDLRIKELDVEIQKSIDIIEGLVEQKKKDVEIIKRLQAERAKIPDYIEGIGEDRRMQLWKEYFKKRQLEK